MNRGLTISILIIGLVILSPAQDRKQVLRGRGEDSGEVSRARPRAQDPKRLEPKTERKEKRPAEKEQGPSRKDTESHSERNRPKGVPADSGQDLPQATPVHKPQEQSGKRSDQRRVFETVKEGLNGARIGSFAELLAPQVHVNLKGGETGYFSSGQAYYVLENYFQAKKISGLEFSTLEESGLTPYATGSAGFHHKGSRETAQVYVSLSQLGDRWVITQIKIY